MSASEFVFRCRLAMPKFAIVSQFALCLLLVTFAGCASNEFVPSPPPEVDVAHPLKQTITRSLEFTGTTEAFKTVEIQARVKGFLESIEFDEGDGEVQAGDLLYVIEKEPFEVKVAQATAAVKLAQAEQLSAKAQLASTQADQRNAEMQLARTRGAGAAVTQADIDNRVADLAIATASVDGAKAAQVSADSQLAAAQAALAEARLDLSYTEVRSPISGRVGRTLVDVGNLVGANETTHLTTVVQYDPIYAYYTISEAVLLQWKKWQREGLVESSPSNKIDEAREIFLGLANEEGFPHKGKGSYADLGVDASSGTFLVRAVFDNEDESIPDGAFVRIRVPLFPEEALLVDEVAVGRDQAGPYVLAIGPEDKVERRSVALGPRYEGMRVIETGLTTDDRVIVNGLQRARPGLKVKLNEVEMKSSTPTDATSNEPQEPSAEPAGEPAESAEESKAPASEPTTPSESE